MCSHFKDCPSIHYLTDKHGELKVRNRKQTILNISSFAPPSTLRQSKGKVLVVANEA